MGGAALTIATVPPGAPFLDRLAGWWLARSPDPIERARGLILLPTRRAARALTAAFLRATDGGPLLLPRITAIGALDEGPLALAGALDLPPAIAPMERLAALTRLILGMGGRHGAPDSADRAWPLAAELARLLDEAHREEADLAGALPGLVAGDFARHWQDTLAFLSIVTDAWPRILAERGRIDPAGLGVRLLRAQAAAWTAAPPEFPVVIAGTAGGLRATAELMRVVARLPQGLVLLPGLDLDLAEAAWESLDPSHPQAGMRRLLADMQATRGDVAVWPPAARPQPGTEGRAALIQAALLPAGTLAAWRSTTPPPTQQLQWLERLEPDDQQHEAVAIALVLRAALERPGAQAALATPDRQLAARVAAELARFGIVADDSAGEPLAETPPGLLLRLLAQTAAEALAPVCLLALLKHPLAALGLEPARCRRLARELELACLRGPAPPPGLAGLRQRAGADAPVIAGLLDRLERALAPLLALPPEVAPARALAALIEAAEALATTPQQPGTARLWALEEGEALATHLAELLAALPALPPQPLRSLPGLLDATLQGAVVRSRRALRGRDGTEHPRVAILGLLEARLQGFDTLVLGSLAEQVWPPAADPGPWLSRPMRAAAGLASPEALVGEMAHDFAMLACAAPHVVLSCPRRREGAPAVPARWLVRLEAFLRGQGRALPRSPAAEWARRLDQPAGPPVPAPPPLPCPPVAARPRRLSVSDVETWIRDPYGLYARRVLGLRALDPLEQSAEAADFGTLVHAAIAAWLAALPPPPAFVPGDANQGLRRAMLDQLDRQPIRPALAAWWRPRLLRIADWVAGAEHARRLTRHGVVVGVERPGEWTLPAQVAPVLLRARADRIERLPDGGIAILDYKTGTLPTSAHLASGHAPQLPLEAAMAAAGAFGPDCQGTAAELTFWRLTGGHVAGEARPLREDVAELAARAGEALAELIRRFDDPAEPYRSCPDPSLAPRFSDYRQLARQMEWAAWEGEEEG